MTPAKYTLTVSKVNLIRFHVNHETAYARYLGMAFCKYPQCRGAA